ncbi:MAG: hypothetical protein CSB44_03805 [Gammaproteobacteria bacterium]|nr:MAG: hypothetical protein CSB44_03805 [Gammaproteobacteria bacterium]
MDFIDTILHVWHEFMQFKFARETLMVVGALLFVFSAWSILKASLRLLIWVMMMAVGVMAFSYGLNETTYDVPLAGVSDLNDLRGYMSLDTLRLLCARLPE